MKLSIAAPIAVLAAILVPAIAQAKAQPPVGKCDRNAATVRCNLPGWATKFVVTGTIGVCKNTKTLTCDPKLGPWSVPKTGLGEVPISIDCGPNSGALSTKAPTRGGFYTIKSSVLLGFSGLLHSSHSCLVAATGTLPAHRPNVNMQVVIDLNYS